MQNKQKELCFKLAIYKDFIEMRGQQNIKFCIAKKQNKHISAKGGCVKLAIYKRFIIIQILETNILRIPNSIVYFRKIH